VLPGDLEANQSPRWAGCPVRKSDLLGVVDADEAGEVGYQAFDEAEVASGDPDDGGRVSTSLASPAGEIVGRTSIGSRSDPVHGLDFVIWT
jgi:hypothetical protein